MSKIFLTDVDGVLLNWCAAFEEYVNTTKYKTDKPFSDYSWSNEWLGLDDKEGDALVHDFHLSEHYSKISAFDDAKEILNMFHDDGWKFIAITAVPDHHEIREMREENLERFFPGFFNDVIMVDYFGSKIEELTKFDQSYWVDDMQYHVSSGINAGHESFHMVRSMYEPFPDDHGIRQNALFNEVNDWYKIYDKVKKS